MIDSASRFVRTKLVLWREKKRHQKKGQPMTQFMKRCLGRRRLAVCFLAAVCALTRAAGAQGQAAAPAIGPAADRKWVDAWAVSYLPTTVNGTLQAVPTFHDQTLRLNMFLKLGGTGLRVKLSNRFSKQPLVIGSAHVAVRRQATGSDIVPETDRVLTFDGAKDAHAGAGQRDLERSGQLGSQATRGHHGQPVFAGIDDARGVSPHRLKTQYVAAGDHCGDATLLSAGMGSRTVMYFFVSDIASAGPGASKVIVALGDSITDGAAAANDAMPPGRMCFPSACRRCRTARRFA
jgi:hypothetical protein